MSEKPLQKRPLPIRQEQCPMWGLKAQQRPSAGLLQKRGREAAHWETESQDQEW